MTNFSFIKNKNLLEYYSSEPQAFATYRINSQKYDESIIEEIAIGQSLGAWETSHVSEVILKQKVAKVTDYKKHDQYFDVTIAFPYNLWLGKLSWLLTIIYGKMSFYPGIQLNSIEFSKDCFSQNLCGPKNSLPEIRNKVRANSNSPLLMGILKPNVAMTPQKISDLYVEAAEAGIHLLKDDEIRHDHDENEILNRIQLVADAREKNGLSALYAVHLQINSPNFSELIKKCEQAGANAFLINTWISGIDVLQQVRKLTNLPIFSHPALVGAFGIDENNCTIHPRVTLAQLLRAAGADFSLFPSPYGKLGLSKEIALSIAKNCLSEAPILPTIPVPSAGIKPEHTPLAMEDFGTNFVLNAGTGIFAGNKTIRENIVEFKKHL